MHEKYLNIKTSAETQNTSQ